MTENNKLTVKEGLSYHKPQEHTLAWQWIFKIFRHKKLNCIA